jgi:hypothetical protein
VIPPAELLDGSDGDPGKRNYRDGNANLSRQLGGRLREQKGMGVADLPRVLGREEELLHVADGSC